MERHHISEHIYGKLGCEEQIWTTGILNIQDIRGDDHEVNMLKVKNNLFEMLGSVERIIQL